MNLDALPEELMNLYVKLTVESDEDEDKVYFCATLMSPPPAGGWPTGCHYFGHLRGVHEEGAECCWAKEDFPYKYDDSVIAGTTTETLDDLHRLTKTMVLRHMGVTTHDPKED